MCCRIAILCLCLARPVQRDKTQVGLVVRDQSSARSQGDRRLQVRDTHKLIGPSTSPRAVRSTSGDALVRGCGGHRWHAPAPSSPPRGAPDRQQRSSPRRETDASHRGMAHVTAADTGIQPRASWTVLIPPGQIALSSSAAHSSLPAGPLPYPEVADVHATTRSRQARLRGLPGQRRIGEPDALEPVTIAHVGPAVGAFGL